MIGDQQLHCVLIEPSRMVGIGGVCGLPARFAPKTSSALTGQGSTSSLSLTGPRSGSPTRPALGVVLEIVRVVGAPARDVVLGQLTQIRLVKSLGPLEVLTGLVGQNAGSIGAGSTVPLCGSNARCFSSGTGLLMRRAFPSLNPRNHPRVQTVSDRS